MHRSLKATVDSFSPAPAPDESVHSALPFAYIEELRRTLAEGPNFCDWKFAASALGTKTKIGAPSPDWFAVPDSVIDERDPDCVYRHRKVKDGSTITEMWSPVRWVALLLKLLLPTRTSQILWLDSGESDTWRYESGKWVKNAHPLANELRSPHSKGNRRKDIQQGAFRRILDDPDCSVVLYINTNKTSDDAEMGSAKGFLLPWHQSDDCLENPYYWLEKLRNWQEKYNPVRETTPWNRLDARHISAKSREQFARYSPACFIMRMPECTGEEDLPCSAGILETAYGNLLFHLQRKIAGRGETHEGGTPIVLVHRNEAGNFKFPFTLHGLRVAMISDLVIEGNLPLEVVQKLVGHRRWVMTLYYTKLRVSGTQRQLKAAIKRVEEAKDRTLREFLLEEEHSSLAAGFVAHSPESILSAIPADPTQRNAVGWMDMHLGLCVMGGNTSPRPENLKIGGCFNGGRKMGDVYGPVPGGARNCSRCRWLATTPAYLPKQVAQFNVASYHFGEAIDRARKADACLAELRRKKIAAEYQDSVFLDNDKLKVAERVWEAEMKKVDETGETMIAVWRLAVRCAEIANSDTSGRAVVLATGDDNAIRLIEAECSSLMQQMEVCEALELYPDLAAPTAPLQLAQALDVALDREGHGVFFIKLAPEEQLLAINAFIRDLAGPLGSGDLLRGKREVVSLLESGRRIGASLGVDLTNVLQNGRAGGKALSAEPLELAERL